MHPERAIITAAAAAKLRQLAQAAVEDGSETGGEFVGYVEERPEGPTFVVTDLCGPGPLAERSYSRLAMDADYIHGEIIRMCAGSEDRIYSIGGWHTHFQVLPRPSSLDDENGLDMARWRASWAPHMPVDLEIILGFSPHGKLVTTRAWCYDDQGGRWDVELIDEQVQPPQVGGVTVASSRPG